MTTESFDTPIYKVLERLRSPQITARQLGVLRYLKVRGECTPQHIVKESTLFREIHYPRCVKDLETLKKDMLVSKRRTITQKGNKQHIRRNWWKLTLLGDQVVQQYEGKELDPSPKQRQLLEEIIDSPYPCAYKLAQAIYGAGTGSYVHKIQERLKVLMNRGEVEQFKPVEGPATYTLTVKGAKRLEQYQG